MTEEEAGHPNVALDEMRAKLYESEILQRELEAKFTPAHPRVVAIKEQGETSADDFGRAGQRPLGVRRRPSIRPTKNWNLELLTQQAEAKALAAKVASLRNEQARVDKRIQELNEAEVKIVRLEKELQLAHANYTTYASNLEQTRIDQALQEDAISNVNVIQPATVEWKPATPKPLLVLVLGMAVAGLGSIAVAYMSEQVDYSLSTPEDVEREVELPVLVSLPRLAGHQVASRN